MNLVCLFRCISHGIVFYLLCIFSFKREIRFNSLFLYFVVHGSCHAIISFMQNIVCQFSPVFSMQLQIVLLCFVLCGPVQRCGNRVCLQKWFSAYVYNITIAYEICKNMNMIYYYNETICIIK